MTGLLPYLLKSVLCSALLYGYYHVALRNRLFHQWNRFYLLLIVPLSLVLPLGRIELSTARQPQAAPLSVRLLQVVSDGNTFVEESVPVSRSFDPTALLYCIYTVVSLVLLVHFAHGLWQLHRIAKRYPAQRMDNIDFILAPVPGTPFSFFHRVFWNPELDPASDNGRQILEHELVHVREWHSLDKILLQAVLTLFWFNPVFWLLRKELHLVHEFIADRRSVRNHDTGTLASLILQAAYPQQFSQLANSFFHRAIKRRLYMLNQMQKARVQYVGRVAALPLLALIAATFALRAQSPDRVSPAPASNTEKFTVVIDPGHGRMPNGSWNGASSNGVVEDELTLALAKRIQALNANPNLEIVFTRTDENVVDLKKRSEVATAAGADLFLSLHVDQLPVNAATNAGKGFTIYVAPESGRQKGSQLFGSALQRFLAGVYHTDKQLHARNAGAFVLKNSPCPAALIEFGYINKPEDRAFLVKDENQDRIARCVLNAIAAYKLRIPSLRPVASPDKLQAPDTVRPPADLVPLQGPADVVEPLPLQPAADAARIDATADRRTMETPASQNGVVPPVSIDVITLHSGDTLSIEQLRLIPIKNLLAPEGLELMSCRLSGDLKNGDIVEYVMRDGQVSEGMKSIPNSAWSGQMLTVDNRIAKTSSGETKKLPALVYFIK